MAPSLQKRLGTGPFALPAPIGITGALPSGSRRAYQIAWRAVAAAGLPDRAGERKEDVGVFGRWWLVDPAFLWSWALRQQKAAARPFRPQKGSSRRQE